MIALRDYQNEKVRELVEKSSNLLSLVGNKKIVFKSPTGSGKTIMMAEYLKQLQYYYRSTHKLSYIWTAPRKLHNQSKDKLASYFLGDRTLICSNFEDLENRRIQEGEILFLNWESINKADNIYIRENEQDFNLTTVLSNTREAGNEIILIIDESHHTAGSLNSTGIIEMINPKLTIDVSATPSVDGDEWVIVQREDVIAEGMIKKSVSINPGFKNTILRESDDKVVLSSDSIQSTDEFVLSQAVFQRQKLLEIYKSVGSTVNPLLLIQLPDHNQSSVVDYQHEIQRLLEELHNITVANGKLAIYLSEDKENLENITRNSSLVEVMLFKQAIALGWDCPRASILALFRDWKDFTFSTQTLGRIMRMPEIHHYDVEELNIAYVYTTVGEINVIENLANEFVTFQISTYNRQYENVSLDSVHSKRVRAKTRLSPLFSKYFNSSAKSLNLNNRINLHPSKLTRLMLSDGRIFNADQTIKAISDGSGSYQSEVVERNITPLEIQQLFDSFIRASLKEFYPEERSVNRLKNAIYDFFTQNFPVQFIPYDSEIPKIVLAPENIDIFLGVINQSEILYKQEIEKEIKTLEVQKNWCIPSTVSSNNQYEKHPCKKSILEPFYLSRSSSKIEIDFITFLESNVDVLCWFKNRDRDATFFAIPYESNGDALPFYIDWIVRFKSGKIGLFDTKAGFTASIAKEKAEGLSRYIQLRSDKLVGGIVIKDNDAWLYNDNLSYEYNPHDLSKWKALVNLT